MPATVSAQRKTCFRKYGRLSRRKSIITGDHSNSALYDVPILDIYLIDGTYELFRHFFAVPSFKGPQGQEIGAVRGVLNSIRSMIDQGATHLGVATDQVIESFRNDLYPGYKTGAGIPPELYS